MYPKQTSLVLIIIQKTTHQNGIVNSFRIKRHKNNKSLNKILALKIFKYYFKATEKT